MIARSVQIGEDRRLVVVDRPVPLPGPAEVEVTVAYCGICGSDLHFRDIPALFPCGTVPGHELSGRISAIGDDVEGWSVGDRVAILPFAQCGECELCRAGEEQVCPHAVNNGVGLGTALVLRARGFERLVIVSRNPARARAAEELGLATVALDDAPSGVSAALGVAPAVVFECAGTPDAATLAVHLVRQLGRVVLVGIALDTLSLPATAIVFNEVEIVGALTYRRDEFAEAIDLLAAGHVPSEALITGVVGLERAEEMFQTLTAPGNTHIKVLLEP